MTSRSFWIGAVSAVVVVALAVGGAFLVSSLGGSDVELPDEVDGLVALDSDAAIPEDADMDPDERAQALEDRSEGLEYSAEKLSDAFDGADAAVRSYADADEFDPIYNVTAIAADAGPLIPERGFADPERLGLALPLVDRVEEGDAECIVGRNQPPVAGSDLDEEDEAIDYLLCQRTSGSLTVRVAVSDGDLGRTVDFLDEVWDEID